MTAFNIPVRTELTPTQYKHLHAVATEHKTTVSALVAELVRRGLTTPAREPNQGGRRSNYTTHLGEQVHEARRFHRSYQEIGAELGIAAQTAQRYMRRYEAELRTAALAKTPNRAEN